MDPTQQAPPDFVAIIVPTVDYQVFAACFASANLGKVPGDTLAVAKKFVELSERVAQPQGVNIQDEPTPEAVPDNVTSITPATATDEHAE